MKKWLSLIVVVLTASCSTIDCPLNSMVSTLYNIYDADGELLELSDSLTIVSFRKDGIDTTLNKLIGKS